jgi:LysM repeat protein
MKRTVFLVVGLCVLFALPNLTREALAGQTYEVRPGDTLSGIATQRGVTLEALKRANQLTDSLITPRQILRIPTANADPYRIAAPPAISTQDAYRVLPGDTLSGIAVKTGIPVPRLRDLNRISGDRLQAGQTLRLRPVAAAPSGAPEPLALAGLTADRDMEEEEGDLGLPSEETWEARERRRKENEALLGSWNTPEEPKLLVKVATGFLGAPYRLGGSSVTGLDCSAFVRIIYDIFSINLPRTASEQARIGLKVPRSELAEGDLIFFNTRRAFGHVGIYIGNNEFVHASSVKRKVRVDSLDTPYFDRRFVRAVRLKGMHEGL